MAVINADSLVNLEGIKVSKDLTSYSMFVYGPPKIGKSTFVHKLYGDRVLFLATENRHKTLGGAKVQPITSWLDYLQVMKALSNPKVKEQYDVICVDTLENLYDMCERYVLNKFKINELGEFEWGKDYADLKKRWKNGLKMIENNGYIPAFIGHAVQKTEQIPVSGVYKGDVNETMEIKKDKKTQEQYYEFLKYTTDLKDKAFSPVNKMVDNILFMTVTTDEEMKEHRVIHLRESLQWMAGCDFEHLIESPIPLSVDAYKKAIQDAIEQEEHTTDEKAKIATDEELDYNELMDRAKELGVKIVESGKKKELTALTDKILGAGVKIKDVEPNQTETLAHAIREMEDLLNK